MHMFEPRKPPMTPDEWKAAHTRESLARVRVVNRSHGYAALCVLLAIAAFVAPAFTGSDPIGLIAFFGFLLLAMIAGGLSDYWAKRIPPRRSWEYRRD